MNGWTAATTATLYETRARLLQGLALVYDHIVAGDVHEIHGGHSSPADAGFITLILLDGVEAELTRRARMKTAYGSTILFDVLDPVLLRDMLATGYVRSQVHPTLPLTILNYTEKAAYEGVWNNVTSRCRGLIYHNETDQILARPWAKFFNYGQAGAPDLHLDDQVLVTDKADGSLGILYRTPDGWAVATRGSFASDQAVHATAVLHDRYAGFRPPAGCTVLVEIVYPANRIVINYGGLDDLILLGAVNIATGRSIPPTDDLLSHWRGPRTAVFGHKTLGEAIAAQPRPNAEGLVVQVLRTDDRIKIKQEDYVALHKIVTGLNARTVWQHLVDGKPLDELITPLPDEFHTWVKTTAEEILAAVDERERHLHALFAETNRALGDVSRKDFAIAIGRHPDKSFLFSIADGKDIRSKLLANAKPDAYVTPSGRIFTEETA